MLNQDGKISAHYVDSIGFKELLGFLDKKLECPSVLQNLKEKCDAPECNPTVCRKRSFTMEFDVVHRTQQLEIYFYLDIQTVDNKTPI